jgi:hypothetical protein
MTGAMEASVNNSDARVAYFGKHRCVDRMISKRMHVSRKRAGISAVMICPATSSTHGYSVGR